jgi:hypothetical protein
MTRIFLTMARVIKTMAEVERGRWERMNSTKLGIRRQIVMRRNIIVGWKVNLDSFFGDEFPSSLGSRSRRVASCSAFPVSDSIERRLSSGRR